MSRDKLPTATTSSRTSRKTLKDRMNGVSVKLENMPDSQYGQAEKRNPVGCVGKNQRMSLGESEKDSGFSGNHRILTVQKEANQSHPAPIPMDVKRYLVNRSRVAHSVRHSF